MTILIIISAFAAVFYLLYRFIGRADQYFHSNKKTPSSSNVSNILPDDGGSEYIQNFNKFMGKDEET